MFDLLHLFLSLDTHILIFLDSYATACTLASSYPYVHEYLSVSLHPYISISSGFCTLVFIPVSIYPQLHVCLQDPCPLTSYPQVLKCLLVSSNPCFPQTFILICDSTYNCFLPNSYPYGRMNLLVPSHRYSHLYILISSSSCTLLESLNPHFFRFVCACL